MPGSEEQSRKPILGYGTYNPNPGSDKSTNGSGSEENPNYSGSGGYSSGGSDSGNQAIDNLTAVSRFNADTANAKVENTLEAYKIAMDQNAKLRDKNLSDVMRSNEDDWFKQNKKNQNATASLVSGLGNGMYGSGLYSMFNAADEQNSYVLGDSLKSLRENANTIYNDYNEAAMSNNNAINDLYISQDEANRNLVADYIAQVNSIDDSKLGNYISSGEVSTIPEWAKTNNFEKNRQSAVELMSQGYYLPDKQADRNRSNGYTSTHNPDSQSTNNSYFERQRLGYNRRS